MQLIVLLKIHIINTWAKDPIDIICQRRYSGKHTYIHTEKKNSTSLDLPIKFNKQDKLKHNC